MGEWMSFHSSASLSVLLRVLCVSSPERRIVNSNDEQTPQMAENWWAEYFDDVFLRIYRPLLGPERTRAEVDAIQELLQLAPGARVLDVGCGWGRHSVELARRGFKVTGFDLSGYLLREAERAADEAGVDVRWVRGDMRELPFRTEFDAAISLFSSLGFFDTDADDAAVLSGVRSAVVDGGGLLIESMHRDLVVREFAERDWWETPDGDRVWVEREFDAVRGISRETLRWRALDGSEGAKPHAIRIRSATEWKDLLERTGWRPEHWFGDWSLEPFDLTSERLLIHAGTGGPAPKRPA